MGLLQMSLSGAVMIAAVVIIRALAINHLPKKTFLILWGIVLLRLMVPFSIPSALSVYSLAGRNGAGISSGEIFSGQVISTGSSENGAAAARANTDNFEDAYMGQGDITPSGKAEMPHGDRGEPNQNQGLNGENSDLCAASGSVRSGNDRLVVIDGHVQSGYEINTKVILDTREWLKFDHDTGVSCLLPPQKRIAYVQDCIRQLRPFCFVIWCAGMLICASYFAVSYLRCRLRFRESLPVEDDFVQKWVQECIYRCRVSVLPAQNARMQKWLQAYPRRLRVRQSDRISTPLTYGILHPVILMPKSTDWKDRQQLRYVLMHEYVHIRRYDALTKLLVTCALCVHWFNPMVWMMWILFNRDVEISCDESVLRCVGDSSKSAYAMMLIQMASERCGVSPLCSGLLFRIGENAMEERITAIMKMKKKSKLAMIVATVLVICMTTVFSTSAAEGKNTGKKDTTASNAKMGTIDTQYKKLPALHSSGDEAVGISEHGDKGWIRTDKEEWLKERLDEWDRMVEEIERRKVVADELRPAENLRWSEEIPGMAVFYNPNNRVRFVLHCFKDGQEERVWDSFAWIGQEVMVPIYGEIYESGTYTFQVEIFAYDGETDYDLSSGCISEMSSEFSYTRPDTQLSAPSDIQLNSEGVLSWSDVEHADSYWCYLYRSDKSAGDGEYRLMGGDERQVTNMDYRARLEDDYQYSATVRVISENINLYANSRESAYVSLNGF